MIVDVYLWPSETWVQIPLVPPNKKYIKEYIEIYSFMFALFLKINILDLI